MHHHTLQCSRVSVNDVRVSASVLSTFHVHCNSRMGLSPPMMALGSGTMSGKCMLKYFQISSDVGCCGVGQVCGGYPDSMARCAQLLEEYATVDFVDINMGCPIDMICNKCGTPPQDHLYVLMLSHPL